LEKLPPATEGIWKIRTVRMKQKYRVFNITNKTSHIKEQTITEKYSIVMIGAAT
jgi:hypothetical protein